MAPIDTRSDPLDDIEIDVTQEDVDRALAVAAARSRYSTFLPAIAISRTCPLAQAIRRELGEVDIYVGYDYAYIGGVGYAYLNEDEAQDVINTFDDKFDNVPLNTIRLRRVE